MIPDLFYRNDANKQAWLQTKSQSHRHKRPQTTPRRLVNKNIVLISEMKCSYILHGKY